MVVMVMAGCYFFLDLFLVVYDLFLIISTNTAHITLAFFCYLHALTTSLIICLSIFFHLPPSTSHRSHIIASSHHPQPS